MGLLPRSMDDLAMEYLVEEIHRLVVAVMPSYWTLDTPAGDQRSYGVLRDVQWEK